MTFNDLEGQNHIAYSAIRPNMNMYAKFQVNPFSGKARKEVRTDKLTDAIFIYIDILGRPKKTRFLNLISDPP